MNAISDFFVRNIVAVFFFYGLAFFVMGMALALAGRRTSQFRFAVAILPLAAFGFLHAGHEWFEMFQKIGAQTHGHVPGIGEELVRLTLLVLSFVALLTFGLLLLTPKPTALSFSRRRVIIPIASMLLIWLAGTAVVVLRFRPAPMDAVVIADDLARYGLCIPAAVLSAWALMSQQHTFREHNMPQFGRDLVWAAAALLLYGAVGQLFVRETVLAPSRVLNNANFLLWFGIPVQLFRAVMAAGLTFFLMRALRAFDLEHQRRLEHANDAKLSAQAAALEAERRTTQQTEQLNEELRLAAHKLSLLLDLSNLLNAAVPLPERLHQVLERIVQSLPFSKAGLILLAETTQASASEAAATGFAEVSTVRAPDHALATALGKACMVQAYALCQHVDGQVIHFQVDALAEDHECRQYASPAVAIALPLTASERVIGSLVLARPSATTYRLSLTEPALMAGIAQQLGLSIENALLHQEAQAREQVLGELLHQVVGAQEAERQRIARELHDATAQSLTAISLGLRGVETYLAHYEQGHDPRILIHQVKELRTFGQTALGELRNIISDLRPPQLDDLGLAAALRWYLQAYAERRGIVTRFFVTGDDSYLPPEYKTVLFRIAQEALTNIAKHARATSAEVTLTIQPPSVQLDVRDNGRGFDARLVSTMEAEQPAGWGLVGIRERALLLGGHSEIETAPGQGTQLHVVVLLAATGEQRIVAEGA